VLLRAIDTLNASGMTTPDHIATWYGVSPEDNPCRNGNARRQFKNLEIDKEILADQDLETMRRRVNRLDSHYISGRMPGPLTLQRAWSRFWQDSSWCRVGRRLVPRAAYTSPRSWVSYAHG
jgi:hypothetical protein